MKNKIKNIALRSVTVVAAKTSASLRLGAGIGGSIAAGTGLMAGGAICAVGGAVALVGFGTWVIGANAYSAATKLAEKSFDLSDKAYDDLTTKTPGAVEAPAVAPASPFGDVALA